jgi:hypothetical protein
MENEQLILSSVQDKDSFGKHHVISTEFGPKPAPDSFAGILRVHHSGERFTVISNERKPRDDREGHLAGIAFSDAGKSDHLVQLVIVLTVNGKSHFPISKRWELSRVAVAASKGETIDGKFVQFKSKLIPSKDGWREALRADTSAVIKSQKNCVVEAENGELLFVLYKLAENWFTVKCKAPFSPFVAFGIALALVGYAK